MLSFVDSVTPSAAFPYWKCLCNKPSLSIGRWRAEMAGQPPIQHQRQPTVDHCVASHARVKQQQSVGGTGGWWDWQAGKLWGWEKKKESEREREKERERQWGRPELPPSDSQQRVDVDSSAKWLSHDLQAQTVCWALGRLSAQPENRSFVWRGCWCAWESALLWVRGRHRKEWEFTLDTKRCVKNESSVRERFFKLPAK